MAKVLSVEEVTKRALQYFEKEQPRKEWLSNMEYFSLNMLETDIYYLLELFIYK